MGSCSPIMSQIVEKFTHSQLITIFFLFQLWEFNYYGKKKINKLKELLVGRVINLVILVVLRRL